MDGKIQKRIAVVLALAILAMTSGCEFTWIVPPASGRVIDAQTGQPVSSATVKRICDDAPAKTKTRKDGSFKFHGKWCFEFPLGDAICAPHYYQFEAVGYQTFRTNSNSFGWATISDLRDNLGIIEMAPK